MATSNAQRIGIWVIAVVLTVGTIGSFVVIVLSNDNAKLDKAQQEKDYAAQIAEYEKQQKEAAQANADNSEALEGYSAGTFDAAAVTELKTEVLVEGTGGVVKSTDTIKASYFGWTSDGKIFDSSNKKDADDAPVTFSLAQVIKGWTNGLAGQKFGSVVKLTIPAELGYGSTGSGVIPADAPLQFIVIIHSLEENAS